MIESEQGSSSASSARTTLIATNWGTVGPMKCPGCASDMVQVELHSIEIDRCPACGGIVLDKGEGEAIGTGL